MQVPSEIHTIRTRAAGQSCTVFVKLLASFLRGAILQQHVLVRACSSLTRPPLLLVPARTSVLFKRCCAWRAAGVVPHARPGVRVCHGVRSHMQFGVRLFFAAFVIIMTLWVAYWLPETRGIPVEHFMAAWAM